MRVVQINVNDGGGSVGKICLSISKVLTSHYIDNYILYSFGEKERRELIRYTNKAIVKLETLFEKLTGLYGFLAPISTFMLIKELKQLKPDVVHLHNVHNHNADLRILFKYLKKNNIRVIWTFHDCWAFTGYCMHFVMDNCDKWKNQCSNCPQYKKYSLFFDKSKFNFLMKRKYSNDLDLTVVTPSKWMANCVNKSFLKNHKCVVINNGIDLNVFKPQNSDFKLKYSCQNKIIILGVAYKWTYAKGIDVFIKLANALDDNYQIVLVGTDENIERKIPTNIICIRRTNNQHELAEIYSAADVLVNPTREDTFPTVNMEAIACGTPVITFNTGGSPEIVSDKTGVVVDGYLELYNLIKKRRSNKLCFSEKECVEYAKHYFDEKQCFEKYYELYRKV